MCRVINRSIPALCLTAALAAASPAGSAPSQDTLAVAKDIADLITLDPAHAFELSAGEIFANVYDRLAAAEPGSPARTRCRHRRKPCGQPGRTNRHVQAARRSALSFGQPGASGGRGVLAGTGRQARRDAGVHPRPARLEPGQCRGADRGGGRPPCPHRDRVAALARPSAEHPLLRRRVRARPGACARAREGRRPGRGVACDEQRGLGPVPAGELDGRGVCRSGGRSELPGRRPGVEPRNLPPRARSRRAAAPAGGGRDRHGARPDAGRDRRPAERSGDCRGRLPEGDRHLPGGECRAPGPRQGRGGRCAAPRGRLPRHGVGLSLRAVRGAPGVLAGRSVGGLRRYPLPARSRRRARSLLAEAGHAGGFAVRLDTLSTPPVP